MYMIKRWASALLLAFLAPILVSNAGAQKTFTGLLAAKPPMGWNSWDSYGLRIDEQQFRDNAAALSIKLKPFGYSYAVIDEGWFLKNPEARPHPETLQ